LNNILRVLITFDQKARETVCRVQVRQKQLLKACLLFFHLVCRLAYNGDVAADSTAGGSVTNQFGYAPPRAFPAAHFENNDITIICETMHQANS
jgi:hypothetical protein